MYATITPVEGLPGPQDTTWVDDALAGLAAAGPALGALVARPLGTGPGSVVALWEQAPPDGASPTYDVRVLPLAAAGRPPRYLQLTTFDGPRSAAWAAAYDRAGSARIEPAVRDLPGLVAVLLLHCEDGGRAAVTLAESVEALEAAAVAVMSTTLLPDEDPAHLTGPDGLSVLRLLHADLPLPLEARR